MRVSEKLLRMIVYAVVCRLCCLLETSSFFDALFGLSFSRPRVKFLSRPSELEVSLGIGQRYKRLRRPGQLGLRQLTEKGDATFQSGKMQKVALKTLVCFDLSSRPFASFDIVHK